MPGWSWAVIIAIALIAAAVWSFVSRFRRTCALVREELTELVKREYPDSSVVGETQGNLVVRTEGRGERVWEMTELYSAVNRLPGMGAEPEARAGIYRQGARAFFAPDPAGPLRLETHAGWIRPRLVRADDPDVLPHALREPVPALGLALVYVLDLPDTARCLTAGDRADLGVDDAGLRRIALDALRESFPAETVAGALAGNPTAIQFNDSFDAARLLLVPEHLETGQEVVALVPHRDMLLLFPAGILDDRDRLDEGIRALDDGHHPPLLDRPVRVTRDGFELA
jgi:hypothetical protein